MLRSLPAGFIAPCLPTKADTLPSGEMWLHEIKHDGLRVSLARMATACGCTAVQEMTYRSGYTTGINGNRTVNTYTDRYGNTTGWIGGKYISTYSDGYGGQARSVTSV